MATSQTPYALAFEMEEVVPYEILIPSLRVQIDRGMSAEEKRQALLLHLELLDKKRLAAAEHACVYRQRITKAYQKKVIEHKINIGDLVLKEVLPYNKPHPKGKLKPNWEGPYIVVAAYPGNAYRLSQNEVDFPDLWNEMYLKRLITGGYDKVFEFSPDFRNEGVDQTHNPEFTQVETMWGYADYKDNMDFSEEIQRGK